MNRGWSLFRDNLEGPAHEGGSPQCHGEWRPIRQAWCRWARRQGYAKSTWDFGKG